MDRRGAGRGEKPDGVVYIFLWSADIKNVRRHYTSCNQVWRLRSLYLGAHGATLWPRIAGKGDHSALAYVFSTGSHQSTSGRATLHVRLRICVYCTLQESQSALKKISWSRPFIVDDFYTRSKSEVHVVYFLIRCNKLVWCMMHKRG